MRFYITALLLTAAGFSGYSQQLKEPSFEEIISLASVGSPELSPDGSDVLFQVSHADWENNRYDTEIWISRDGEEPVQFTNNPESSSYGARWSPDGRWIAYMSTSNDKTQIHVTRATGGASFVITSAKNGVQGFEWHPEGNRIAFTQTEDKSKEDEERKKKYGGFAVEDNEFGKSQLWVTTFNPEKLGQYPLPEDESDSTKEKDSEAVQLFPDNELSVGSFKWSPDGRMIAVQLQPDQDILSFMDSDIYLYDVADSSLSTLVQNAGVDGLDDWSPDGRSLLFSSSMNDTTSFFYKNSRVFRINTDGSGLQELGKDFDEDISNLEWTDQGIVAIAWQKSRRKLIVIDENGGATRIIESGPERLIQASFSRDAQKIAFSGVNDDDLSEIYLASFPFAGDPVKLTDQSAQINGWAVSDSEMIYWESEDGTLIEGVLHKPKDYDPARKYPLLVAIHGGPTGISVPAPTPSYVYPIVQWLNKGALILQPNYRGSAGYGEEFRSLNVRNLGVGDAWDVLSGVNSLEEKGLIDGDKVGVMGWSQGGYISAYLTTTSDKFKAVSVGAGISNWMTYYVNTDIHPFTRQYLQATPWSDEDIYKKTSPMTFINNASTPTLIQHGEFDKRVPIPNAYELYQGLQDVGVETRLIVYKGFGHGISKPKERLAATWHNWQWFNKYIWGEEIELPE